MTVAGVAAPARARLRVDRQVAAGAVAVVLGVVDIAVFGTQHGGSARFAMSLPGLGPHIGTLSLPVAATCAVAGAASVAAGVARGAGALGSAGARRAATAVVSVAFVLAFVCWADAGRSLNAVGLLQGTVSFSVPLVLGALAGVLCERAGVINIAIEGQLLLGAFVGAVAASATGNLWLGLVTGSAAGGLLGALLAVFAIAFVVDQVVVGVVINVLAAGLTGYLYDRALVPYQDTLNSPSVFANLQVPGLVDIPVLGPVLFAANWFVYLTYAAIAVVQVALFRTRWGLRVRAVGEHPTAAETVGIKVLATRYRTVVLGSLLAGLGGAYLTIGSVGPFAKNISSGKGYIALAAMIFGRYSPLGALGAALLFGFATSLQNTLSVIGAPISSDVLLMLPYLTTIVVVAGLVGRVRPPAADGKPYLRAGE